MKDVFSKIEQMQKQQQAIAGPMFPLLSTQDTWIELLRWLIQEKDGDFAKQMLEIAAVATWALQTTEMHDTAGADESHAELWGEEENCEEPLVWEDENSAPTPQSRFVWPPGA